MINNSEALLQGSLVSWNIWHKADSIHKTIPLSQKAARENKLFKVVSSLLYRRLCTFFFFFFVLLLVTFNDCTTTASTEWSTSQYNLQSGKTCYLSTNLHVIFYFIRLHLFIYLFRGSRGVDSFRFYCIIYSTCVDTNTKIKSFALHAQKAVDYHEDSNIFLGLTCSWFEVTKWNDILANCFFSKHGLLILTCLLVF